MPEASDLIGLGEAAAIAIDAGLSEWDFVAAVQSGVVDTRIVAELPHVSRRAMEAWCRTHVPRPDGERAATDEAIPDEWFVQRPPA